jgi:3-keto-disaccharide hydrolase/uncharacterized protein DUF4339
MSKQQWFVQHGGEQKGPFTPQAIKQMAESGSLARNDLIRTTGSSTWGQAGSVKGLFADQPMKAELADSTASSAQLSQEWFYGKDGKQHGPFSRSKLDELATTGVISPNVLLWKSGMAEWVEASSVITSWPTPALNEPPPLPVTTARSPLHSQTDNQQQSSHWKKWAIAVAGSIAALYGAYVAVDLTRSSLEVGRSRSHKTIGQTVPSSEGNDAVGPRNSQQSTPVVEKPDSIPSLAHGRVPMDTFLAYLRREHNLKVITEGQNVSGTPFEMYSVLAGGPCLMHVLEGENISIFCFETVKDKQLAVMMAATTYDIDGSETSQRKAISKLSVLTRSILPDADIRKMIKNDTAQLAVGPGISERFGEAQFMLTFKDKSLRETIIVFRSDARPQTASTHDTSSVKEEYAKPVENKTGSNEKQKTSPTKPTRNTTSDGPVAKRVGDVVEWEGDLYSDRRIPAFYGVPPAVLAKMPAEQKRIVDSVEALCVRAEQRIQSAPNATMKARIVDEVNKEHFDLVKNYTEHFDLQKTLEIRDRTGNVPPPPDKAPIKGWVGQVKLTSQDIIVTIGRRFNVNGLRTEEGERLGTNTVFKAEANEPAMSIFIGTHDAKQPLFDDIAQLKDGDWVAVDLPAYSCGDPMTIGFQEGKNQFYAIRSVLAIGAKSHGGTPRLRKLDLSSNELAGASAAGRGSSAETSLGPTLVPSSSNNRPTDGSAPLTFVPLFDGRTLNGWTGDKTNWKVRDGAIVCRIGPESKGAKGSNPPRTYLSTEGTYRNFVLTARFKPSGGDSGVLFRGKPEWLYALQVALGDLKPGSFWDETPVERNEKMKWIIEEARAASFVKQNDWNDIKITANGDKFQCEINGRLAFNATYQNGPYSGCISLKLKAFGGSGKIGSGEVAFKEIMIARLPD